MTYHDIIKTITDRYPDLDIAGLDKETRDAGNDDWAAHEAAFIACVDYLDHVPQSKTYRPYSPSSYGLKHDVERLHEARGEHLYVPNGVMIAAMIHKDVPFKRGAINAIARVGRFCNP